MLVCRLRLLKSAKLTLEDARLVGVTDRIGGMGGKPPKQQESPQQNQKKAAAAEGRPSDGSSSSSGDDGGSSEEEDPAHFSSGKGASAAVAGKGGKVPSAAAAGGGGGGGDGKLTEEQRQQVVDLLRKSRAGEVVHTKLLQHRATMGRRKAKRAAKLRRSIVPELTYAESKVPSHLEVVFLPHAPGTPYGGIFLFSQSARMVRPVRQLLGGGLELLGTLEQSNLDILCPDGGAGGSPGLEFTHAELAAGEGHTSWG